MRNNNGIQVLQRFEQHAIINTIKKWPRCDLQSFLNDLDERELSEIFESLHNNSSLNIDFDSMSNFEVVTLDDLKKHAIEYYNIGAQLINDGKLATLLLAGGQGSRLGAPFSKGMVDIGVNRQLFVFECLINNLKKNIENVGKHIPLLIMASNENYNEIACFLKNNNYFGYDNNDVYIFKQHNLPIINQKGELIINNKKALVKAPDGNGGWVRTLFISGLWDRLKKMKVEWINVFSIDNVLQNIADPVFLGVTVKHNCVSAGKVVKKNNPNESVGTICKYKGNPYIIEYYDLPEKMKTAKDINSNYMYCYGVTLNYLFKLDAVNTFTHKNPCLHPVLKKIKYTSLDGKLVSPDSPNAFKFEYLVLDMIKDMENFLPVEIEREKEFAPIKNLHGPDSIDTARKLLKLSGIDI